MNKKELVAEIAKLSNLTKKDSEAALDAFVNTVGTTIKAGGKVALVGFGTFEVKERAARKGRNPKSGEEILIPATRVPKFKFGKTIKDEVKV